MTDICIYNMFSCVWVYIYVLCMYIMYVYLRMYVSMYVDVYIHPNGAPARIDWEAAQLEILSAGWIHRIQKLDFPELLPACILRLMMEILHGLIYPNLPKL